MKLTNQLCFLLVFSLLMSCNSNNSSTAVAKEDVKDENAIPSPFVKNLSMGNLSFEINAPNKGGPNFLTIQPSGLEMGDDRIEYRFNGLVTKAEVTDMNGDDWPEVIVFTELETENKRAFLMVYTVKEGKVMRKVYFPNVIKDTEYGIGFRGGDTFTLIGKYLIQQFPVYNTADTDDLPTGGNRQIQYQIVDTGTTMAFEVVSVTNDSKK